MLQNELSETNSSRSCIRCGFDTKIPSISFNKNGICNFCKSHDLLLEIYPRDESVLLKKRENLISKIRNNGRDKKYDCIVGVSGGTDSIYTLYQAKKEGLRPLAVHFDNGWNTEIAVQNIENATTKLDIDLVTYVVDWEEFKSLQIAFLKASTPDIEIPTDVAIHGALYKYANEEKIKYILGGQNFISEGTVPREWSYIDGTFVKSINKLYGDGPLRTYPNATIYKIFYYTFIKGIKQIPFLNYYIYNKDRAREILEKKLDWSYYGGHHYENNYSHFAFGWYTYNKFKIDKRKVSLSGPIRMGELSLSEANKILEKKPPVDEEIIDYVIKKLGIDKKEFTKIYNLPPKSFHDYHTSYPIIKKFGFILKIAVKLGLVTPVLYEKYLG